MYKFYLIILFTLLYKVILAQQTYNLSIDEIPIQGPIVVLKDARINIGDTLTMGYSFNKQSQYSFVEDDERFAISQSSLSGINTIVTGLLISNKLHSLPKYIVVSKSGKGLLYIEIEEAINSSEIIAINGRIINKEPKKLEYFQLTDSKEVLAESIAKSLDSSVVMINGYSVGSSSQGSGVIISSLGYILTNYHVIAGMERILISNSIYKNLPTDIIYMNPIRDIAICKASGFKFKSIVAGKTSSISKGSTVYAMGSTIGYPNMFTKGIISNMVVKDSKYFLLHDAAIGSGNSGGALVNTKGELIGINVSVYTDDGKGSVLQNFNLAIPISDTRFIITSSGYGYVFENVRN